MRLPSSCQIEARETCSIGDLEIARDDVLDFVLDLSTMLPIKYVPAGTTTSPPAAQRSSAA